jgi:uncharacterized membrane protein YcaP (DUF421 family)
MDIDWQQIFMPSGSILEIMVRGTLIYLALFVTMRMLPRRTMGGMAPSDLLVIVLIADAVQNGMSNQYESVTEGLALAAVVFGWTVVIDYIDHRWPRLHLAAAQKLPVVVNGRMLRANMERERITEEELMSQLRLHGQDSLAGVAHAYVEGDGHVSVILAARQPLQP